MLVGSVSDNFRQIPDRSKLRPYESKHFLLNKPVRLILTTWMFHSGDDLGALIADIGSYATRVGFAGEDSPRAYLPSVSPQPLNFQYLFSKYALVLFTQLKMKVLSCQYNHSFFNLS